MAAKKQILIRVSDERYRSLSEIARVAGVSIPSLVRDRLDSITATENRRHRRFEQLLLARIGNALEMVADQCKNQDDRMAVVDVLARLIAIERELLNWKEEHGT